jgi:hypothetical protein
VARAEEYGGSLYQRPPPPTGGRRPAALVVALLAALVVLAPAGPAAAEPPGGPDQFRVGGSVYRPDGTTAVTLVAGPSFGREPPPADRIDVIDAADGSKVKAKVDVLPVGRLEVVLVADASGGPGTVEAIQGALRAFIASLPNDAAVTLVSAGERPHLLAPLTRSRMTALAGLALLAPTAPGLPEAAIEVGLDQLSGAPGSRPVVVEVRSGGFRTPTEAAAPLEPTRDRLRDLGVDVFAVELGTLLAGQDDALPVPLRDGFVIEARSNPDLVGTLDTIATDLAMARYRVVVQLGEPHFVRFQAEWPGVTPTEDTILGPSYVPKRAPLPDAAGPRLGRLAAAVAGVAVIAVVVLLPPWWRRRRVAKRAAVPPAGAGLRLDPIPAATTATRPPAEVVPETGLGGEDVEGAAAVRALLEVGTRPVAELWLGDGVEPAVRAELEALAARRRVPIRSGSRPGAALPVAARALPVVPVRLPALLSAGPSPVVLAVAGSPAPVELGRALAAADPGGGVDGEVPPITGVVLSRRPTRLTAAATAAAAGAVDRLPFALVRDLGAALASARVAGARVVGVVPGRPGRGTDGLPPAAVVGPTVFVVAADDDLERRLRARCDEVVQVPGAGLAERVAALVAALSPEPAVDLR